MMEKIRETLTNFFGVTVENVAAPPKPGVNQLPSLQGIFDTDVANIRNARSRRNAVETNATELGFEPEPRRYP